MRYKHKKLPFSKQVYGYSSGVKQFNTKVLGLMSWFLDLDSKIINK